jgi:hypothetical protein
MDKVRLVDPSELHWVWDDIKPDVIACLNTEEDDVWPEDVYTAIRTGTAWLVYASDEKGYQGMAIITEWIDPYNPKVKKIHIWLCSTSSELITKEGLVLIENFARMRQAQKVALTSSNWAFKRWGEQRGFKVASIEISKEV